MEYAIVLDTSFFIWDEEDFNKSQQHYYKLVSKLSYLYKVLNFDKSKVLMREELFFEIMAKFPYNKIPKEFSDFELSTIQFLSSVGDRMIVYDAKNQNITTRPNLIKPHFENSTIEEVKYLSTRLHSIRNPESLYFTCLYLWGENGDLVTTDEKNQFEYCTICIDSEEDINTCLQSFKKKFEHNPKHDKYKSGEHESPLSCYNDRTKDSKLAQKLLDDSIENGKSFYNFDSNNDTWIVFRCHEDNKYHGFDLSNRELVPNHIRKIKGHR